MPKFFHFKRHKMVTEVVTIDVDDINVSDLDVLREEAFFLFETSGDKYPVIERIVTTSTSHKNDTEVSFWNPKTNNKVENE